MAGGETILTWMSRSSCKTRGRWEYRTSVGYKTAHDLNNAALRTVDDILVVLGLRGRLCAAVL